MGGAALRVCWPPPRPGRKKVRRGRKAAVGRPLDQETPPSEAPKLKAGSKPKVWFLNLDWESHRASIRTLPRGTLSKARALELIEMLYEGI